MKPSQKKNDWSAQQEVQATFMEDIEQSLIKNDLKHYYGIDEFQKLFEKKKLISDAIDQYREKNKNSKDNILRAQQRLYQIEQLAERTEKQSMLLRNQIDKINDAHMMTKILTIQKMIKAKMEHDSIEKKKQTIFRIREDKHRASMVNRSRNQYKSQKLRQLSLMESKIIKDHIDEHKYETIQMKRSKADRIKEDKQRLKDKIKRYQQFKMDQARKNYMSKMQQLKQTLQQRQKRLDSLYRQQIKQEKNYQTTEQVTKEYLGSLFPTETL